MRGCLKFNANDTLNVSPPQSQIGQFARSSVPRTQSAQRRHTKSGGAANVRLGSKADLIAPSELVRFCAISGRSVDCGDKAEWRSTPPLHASGSTSPTCPTPVFPNLKKSSSDANQIDFCPIFDRHHYRIASQLRSGHSGNNSAARLSTDLRCT
jgi:hypothetical protein